MKINLFKKIRKKTKLPKEIFSIIISIIILIILASIFFGPIFLLDQILEIKNSLIVPTLDRFSMTVAENRQPYFINDWKDSFGPIIFNIPLFFWLFFVGSVVLFHDLIKSLRKKERIILTFVYALFLFCLVFSRYSANSILNGVNFQSLFVYFGGLLIFVGSFLYFYHKKYKEGSFFEFQKLEFTYILYFLILTLGLIGARGGIRLIMVLGAISPVAIGFLVVKSFKKYLNSKEDTTKLFLGILILVIILASLFTIWSYYKSDKYVSENFAPGPYQWQWQKAMDWVRMNTAENAVFAHWWDYGYWLQSIGNRATILDGGNAISYWNHLMGRYVLTGTDEQTALDFLYSHNGTHLLIDSTEVGKYTAFSSIGSDVDYDRFSWITTYLMDEKQTQEMNNKTIYFYQGGASLDEDLEWEINGEKMFFPKKAAGVGAIIVGQQNGEEITQPTAIIVYNGGQYSIPLRFAYYAGELHDFGSGLDAGVFFFPKINIVSGQANINNIGALFYLSSRTIHSHLANLYLFDKQTNAFKLVHTEDNLFIENLKTQGVDVGNFVYYQGFQGPIKIWEINYPANMGVNEEFLKTEHPEEIKWATKGEY